MLLMSHGFGNFTASVKGNLTVSCETGDRLNYRRMDNLKTIVSRIEKRLKVVGLKAAPASKLAGLTVDGIRNLQRAAKDEIAMHGGTLRTYQSLAPVLKTTVDWLTRGEGPEDDSVDAEEEGFARKGAPKIAMVPLVDSVPAGKLTAPISQISIDDMPTVAVSGLGSGDFIALTVRGDSMDRLSPDGSIVIINKAERTLVSGKPYVFCVRGEVTFKLWRSDPPRLAPASWNGMHEPRYVKTKADAEKYVVGRVRRSVLDL